MVLSGGPERAERVRPTQHATPRGPPRLRRVRPTLRKPSAQPVMVANGLFLPGRWTRPLRMHWAQTRDRLVSPSTTTLMRWRFGLNIRLLVPVIFLPTPPRYLAFPR